MRVQREYLTGVFVPFICQTIFFFFFFKRLFIQGKLWKLSVYFSKKVEVLWNFFVFFFSALHHYFFCKQFYFLWLLEKLHMMLLFQICSQQGMECVRPTYDLIFQIYVKIFFFEMEIKVLEQNIFYLKNVSLQNANIFSVLLILKWCHINHGLK